MDESTSDGARTSSGIDRRQLLKAGAWAAPVVVLASATPAAAASTTVASLTFNYMDVRFLWDYTNDLFLGIEGSTSIQLVLQSGPTLQLTSMTVAMTLPAQGMVGQSALATTLPVSGGMGVWSAAQGGIANGSATYLFTWAGTLNTGQSTNGLGFTLPGDGSDRPGIADKSMHSVATASGVTPAERTDGVRLFTATSDSGPIFP